MSTARSSVVETAKLSKPKQKPAPTVEEIKKFQADQKALRDVDIAKAREAHDKIEKDPANWFYMCTNIFDGERKELYHCKLTGSYVTKKATKEESKK